MQYTTIMQVRIFFAHYTYIYELLSCGPDECYYQYLQSVIGVLGIHIIAKTRLRSRQVRFTIDIIRTCYTAQCSRIVVEKFSDNKFIDTCVQVYVLMFSYVVFQFSYTHEYIICIHTYMYTSAHTKQRDIFKLKNPHKIAYCDDDSIILMKIKKKFMYL